MKEVYITSATRTAVGALGKSLKNIKAEDLGAAVISDSINRSNIKPAEVDEVIFGQVLTEALDKIQLGKPQLKLVFQKRLRPMLLIKFAVQE